MTLTSKNLKIIALGLAVVLFLFGVWSVWNSVSYNKKKVEFLQNKVEREVRIKVLELEKAEAKTEASLSAELAESSAKERDAIKAELKKERKKHVVVVEEIERMESDELVRVTWRLLQMGMEDIYRNPEGVQFSLAAARRLTIELTYLDFYLKKEKPKLIESDKKAKEEAVYWHEGYAKLDVALDKAEETIKEQANQIAEDDVHIEDLEKQIGRAKFKAVVKTTVAIGVGAAVVKWIIIPLFFGGK